MSAEQDLGHAAIDCLARLWEVDEDRIEKTEYGFDWWPSTFRVSVTARTSETGDQPGTYRLAVTTAVLKNVDLDKSGRMDVVAQLSAIAPSYTWVFTPADQRVKSSDQSGGRIDFWTTAYIREDNAGWLPKLVGGLAILQAIDAHHIAYRLAQDISGQVNASGPYGAPPDDHFDDMLNVDSSFFIPQGQQRNNFQGLDEYAEFAERFGKSDLCFGNGDPAGLTFETPVGTSSILIRLRTDIPHPRLGAGLLAAIEFPFLKSQAEILEDCWRLNFLESHSWTDVPQMGSWHSRKGEDGQYSMAHSFFLPNALYSPVLATNAALWQLGRARWAKDTLYPELQDLTMMQVYEQRFGGEGSTA